QPVSVLVESGLGHGCGMANRLGWRTHIHRCSAGYSGERHWTRLPLKQRTKIAGRRGCPAQKVSRTGTLGGRSYPGRPPKDPSCRNFFDRGNEFKPVRILMRWWAVADHSTPSSCRKRAIRNAIASPRLLLLAVLTLK